jgi:hypothetical protein
VEHAQCERFDDRLECDAMKVNSPPFYRREAFVVGILTIVGAVLRCWSLPRLGLEHFDEGVYALAGSWILSPRGLANIDANLIPFAPPGFPILVGVSYQLTFPWPGITDRSAIAPSLITGIATVPVAAWVSRHVFGPGAGAAAAAFAALSGASVAFSRMALTDSTFLLFWFVALGLGARFVEAPGWRRAIAFGAAIGLAQNIKYNGWLAGGIVVVCVLIAVPKRPRESVRALALAGVAALVALLVYAPWIVFVEKHGGYSSLLAHQRSYTGGVETWLPHWKLQMAQSVALAGLVSGQMSWTGVAWFLAWLGVWRCLPRQESGSDDGRWSGLRYRVGLLGGTFLFGVLPNLVWWLALATVPWLLLSPRPSERLIAVWWIVMSCLTPLYHPYARLWLPVHAAGWIVVASTIVRSGCFGNGDSIYSLRGDKRWLSRRAELALLAVAIAAAQQLIQSPHARPLPRLLGPSDSLRRIAVELSESHTGQPIHVLARPALSFYLRTSGRLEVFEHADWAGLEGARSASVIILDEVQLRQESIGQGLGAFVRGQRPAHVQLVDELNLPTLLDVDPEAAYGGATIGGDAESPAQQATGGGVGARPAARVWILNGSGASRKERP